MPVWLAISLGCLYAAGVYLMLRGSLFRLVIGLALLSHGANLLIFTSGGLVRDRPPLIPDGADAPTGPVADPLPQALILTAIVISFGVLAFALVLFHRTFETTAGEESDELKEQDR